MTQRTIRSTTDTPYSPRELLHVDAELTHDTSGDKLTLRIEVERDAAWTREATAAELFALTSVVLERAKADGYK